MSAEDVFEKGKEISTKYYKGRIDENDGTPVYTRFGIGIVKKYYFVDLEAERTTIISNSSYGSAFWPWIVKECNWIENNCIGKYYWGELRNSPFELPMSGFFFFEKDDQVKYILARVENE